MRTPEEIANQIDEIINWPDQVYPIKTISDFIRSYGRECYDAGAQDMKTRTEWLLDERKLLYDHAAKTNIHDFIRQCRELLSRINPSNPILSDPSPEKSRKETP